MGDDTTLTPLQAWSRLLEGNMRFVLGAQSHPNQDAIRRGEIASSQHPFAAIFGCGDSRVGAEVIFDQGLGDLFVVRTAGHACGPTELGSLEYATAVLETPLIVVLGHDSCGAIKAAISALQEGNFPPGFIRDIVERILPSVISAHHQGRTAVDEIEAEHVRRTVRQLCERSHIIASRTAAGKLGIIGATYALNQGKVQVVHSLGFEPNEDLPVVVEQANSPSATANQLLQGQAVTYH